MTIREVPVRKRETLYRLRLCVINHVNNLQFLPSPAAGVLPQAPRQPMSSLGVGFFLFFFCTATWGNQTNRRNKLLESRRPINLANNNNNHHRRRRYNGWPYCRLICMLPCWAFREAPSSVLPNGLVSAADGSDPACHGLLCSQKKVK